MAPADTGRRLLVVDDAADTRELLVRNLTARGHVVLTAAGTAEAVSILEQNAFDLVITDMKMPGASGLDLVRYVRENLKDTEVIMITGYPSVETAVSAMKAGADEYLPKPFTQEELAGAVDRALQKLALRQASHQSAAMDGTEAPEILGESEAIQKVRRAVGRLAGSALPVLIVGEEGTGKQLVARALHHASPRNEGAFVALACQDVPRDRAVAELFGGPGAGEEQAVGAAGLVDVATHGTLYLEEISALDLAAQDRLLPVLASSTEDDPRGGTRVIAATSSELEPLVTQSLFLPELFRRLSEATIVVPPLRDRGQDVLLFAHRCLRLRAAELGRSAPTFSPHALEVLGSYPWPGNLPELNNCLRGVVTSLKGDTIEVPDFPGPVRTWLQGGAKHLRPIAAVEAEHIRNVLAVVGGNKSRAAEILGISRKTLREKLKQDIRS